MQNISMYLRANSTNAKLVDSFNQPISVLPAITRGMRAMLCLKLLDSAGDPMENLNYASWDFVLAHDWNAATVPQIHVTDGITAVGNEVRIPLTETNTEELIAALGNAASMTIGAELAGFEAGETQPGFLLQFDIQVRNRRSSAGTGTPVPVSDRSYSAAQINALFAARLEVEFSVDGETWGTAQSQSSRLYRFRNASVGKEWSDPLPLIIGPRGLRSTISVGTVTTGTPESEVQIVNSGDEHDAILEFTIPQGVKGDSATISIGSVATGNPGSNAIVFNSGNEHNAVFDFIIPEGQQGLTGDASYLYCAYAEDPEMRGFSLMPAPNLKYRAEIISRIPLNPPGLGDFASAVWTKYLGDDGANFQDVLVADQTTSVAAVRRIVFENADIRQGDTGEVIVNFHNPGTSVETMQNYSLLNGKTLLSSWINGGGSPGGSITNAPSLEPKTADSTTINFSTFTGANA